MPYVTVENFKAGLDKRRSSLSSAVGTLDVATNCHITAGGEVEKRKAFVRYAMPVGAFGLEKTNAGLVTFGSDASVAGLPAWVTYVRLQHPSVLAGEFYSAGSHRMTEVVSSTTHGGLAFVIAKFADGHSYCYFDGTLVADFTAGVVIPSRDTPAEIATAFAALVNATVSYTATQRITPNDDKVDVYGVPGNAYTTTPLEDSAAGTVAKSVVTENGTPSTDALSAVAKFEIVAGTADPGNNVITSVTADGVEILGVFVDWATSNEVTATAVATQINAYQTDIHATAIGAAVQLQKVTAGTAFNNKSVQVIVVGSVCLDDLSFSLGGTNFNLSSITLNGNELLSAAWRATPGTSDNFPAVNADLEAFCAAAAADITSGTFGHGAVASALGTRIYVSRAIVSSSVSVTLTLIATVTGTGTASEGDSVAMEVALDQTELALSQLSGVAINYYRTTGKVTATAVGGKAPFTYLWKEATAGSGNGITPEKARSYKTAFNFWAAIPFVATTGTFVCQVTDSLGVVRTSPSITVRT